MESPFLIGEKTYLRSVAEEDAEFISGGENNPLVRETLFIGLPTEISKIRSKIQNWIQSLESIVFIVMDKATDKPVGQSAFYRIDYLSRAAVFYLAILDPKAWGRGFGTEATRMMVDYAFETLNLNRIQLHVFAGNRPAIAIYQKVGFVQEGLLRQAMFHNNEYCDFWVMGILKSDWQKGKQS